MQRVRLDFLYLVSYFSLALAVETIRPSPADGELIVNDFTQLQSTSHNSLGYHVDNADMKLSFPDDNDPRLVLSPENESSFFYSYLRQPGQCFDGSNFDYISLELKTETALTLLVGFSTNPHNCDETSESVMRYSLGLIKYKATDQERSVVDIPISALPGDAWKSNMNAIMIGGSKRPIEVYSIKLKAASSENVNESTLVNVKFPDSDSTSTTSENVSDATYDVPVLDESTTESDKASEHFTLVVEDFTTDNVNVNALGGTHGSDGTMSQETYTPGQGVFLTSSSASSYWYTVIPCTNSMTFKHYDMILLDVAGPKGGDFSIRLKTQVQCETDFKEFVFKASTLLKVKLDATLQHVVIPFDMMEGFDKKIHTIASVVIGDFRNEGESHENATPMNLNVKSVLTSGRNDNDNDDDDKKQERIPAKEKEENAPEEYETVEESIDSDSGASQSAISILAIVSAVLLFVL